MTTLNVDTATEMQVLLFQRCKEVTKVWTLPQKKTLDAKRQLKGN